MAGTKRKLSVSALDDQVAKRAKHDADLKTKWAATELKDLRVWACYQDKYGRDKEAALDKDYTYGGKSSLFGGKGTLEVDEKERTLKISTCLKCKPGKPYTFQISRVLRIGDSEITETTPSRRLPAIKDEGTAALQLTTASGIVVDLVFTRWNSERKDIYLADCTLTFPASVPFKPAAAAAAAAGKEETKSKEDTFEVFDFEVKSGKVHVTDPCYSGKDIDLSNVKAAQGKWRATVMTAACKGYGALECYAVFKHESVSSKTLMGLIKEQDCSVDSGQIGVFDTASYQINKEWPCGGATGVVETGDGVVLGGFGGDGVFPVRLYAAKHASDIIVMIEILLDQDANVIMDENGNLSRAPAGKEEKKTEAKYGDDWLRRVLAKDRDLLVQALDRVSDVVFTEQEQGDVVLTYTWKANKSSQQVTAKLYQDHPQLKGRVLELRTAAGLIQYLQAKEARPKTLTTPSWGLAAELFYSNAFPTTEGGGTGAGSGSGSGSGSGETKKNKTADDPLEQEFRDFWPEYVDDLKDVTDPEDRLTMITGILCKGSAYSGPFLFKRTKGPTHKKKRNGDVVRLGF